MSSGITSRSFSAMALMVGRSISGLLGLVGAGILSRFWNEHEYGTYREVWLVYLTLSPFVTLGLPASITYFVPQFDCQRQKTLITQSMIILMACGLAIGLVTWAVAGWTAARLGNPELVSLLRTFFLFPVFAMPLLIVDAWLVAIHRAQAAAWFNIWTAMLQFAATVIPVACGCEVATTIHWLTAATAVRFGTVGYGYLVEYRGIPMVWDWNVIREQLRYAVPLGLSGIVGALTLLLDRLVIALWYDTADYAVYFNGANELPVVGIIAGSVLAVITPEFVRLYSQHRHGEILRLWKSSTRKVAILILPLTAFLMVFAQDTVQLLYSERYLASVPIFRIYLLLLPLRITAYGALLMAAGRSRTILTATCGALAMNAALALMLIPMFGMAGAAVATIFSVYAVALWQLNCCARVIAVPLRDIFPWRDLVLTSVAAIWAATVAGASVSLLPTGVFRLFFGFVVTGMIYAVTILLLRQSRSDAQEVLVAIARR